MLDAFTGRKRQQQIEELDALIKAAREERTALSTMLTQVTTRSAKLLETGKALEQVDQKATAAAGSLDVLATRIGDLEQRATSLIDVEKRVQVLMETTVRAQKTGRRAARTGRRP